MNMQSASNVVQLTQRQQKTIPDIISFNRSELDKLIQLYSARVSTGEWRDYAIDMLKDRALFSVFKRASEVPAYVIEKQPRLARRQGAWSVTNANGLILKRGHELRFVLRIFDKKPKLTSI